VTQEAPPQEAPPLGPVALLVQQALPGVQLEPTPTPIDEAVTIQRDDFRRVMETLRSDPRLAFDYLRCLSGVDYLTELETVYHLYSFAHKHTLAVKVRCPYEDPHVPTVSHLWQGANWHERETTEMFGIVYDGHPDLRPLLTEEGLGYFPLRKSHPLADIEEWQEDYLATIEQARQQMAAASGVAAPVDEKARKIEMAQKKAAIIKKTRDEARARGLSPEDEKKAVSGAIAAFEAEQAQAPQAAAAAAPVDERAAKIQAAQAKAAIITKTRDAARAKGLSTEEEKLAVAEALKKFSEQQAAPAPVTAAAPAPAKPAEDRAAKIKTAQAKAALITKTRDEARARGLSPEEERTAVAEALKKYAEEHK
jgi:NADH-quinone oxidoreductase subunit C